MAQDRLQREAKAAGRGIRRHMRDGVEVVIVLRDTTTNEAATFVSDGVDNAHAGSILIACGKTLIGKAE